jgi:prolyl-tRNA synthetase
VILGEKSPGERFPGAVSTYTFEAMMQDRKALQGGTSHYLGQNFAKAQGIQFTNKEGVLQHAYTTSWGVTTRLIGAMIMTHGDDDGIRIPPRIASKHAVVIPVVPKPELEGEVLAYAEKIAHSLRERSYHGEKLSVFVDKRDKRGGEKNWEWIKKGVPLRIEVGPRDIESNSAMVSRRDLSPKEKEKLALDKLPERVPQILDEMQNNYFAEAKAYRDRHIKRDIRNFEELKDYFTPKNQEKPEIHGGFALVKWCEDPETEKMLEDLKLTIRCLPLAQSGTKGRCVLTGRDATTDVIIAKSY